MAAADDGGTTLTPTAMASVLAQLQAEFLGFKAETAIKVASLEDTITGLAHENAVLKRRLYGNKTERSHTSELQLALGDLLVGEAPLQQALDKQVEDATNAAPPPPEGTGTGTPRPHGRRNLLASKLPRVVLEILHAALEARGCRRVGFEDASQLAYRPGGFYVLIKRVAPHRRHDRRPKRVARVLDVAAHQAAIERHALVRERLLEAVVRRAERELRQGPDRRCLRKA